jgi:hypothetical protein
MTLTAQLNSVMKITEQLKIQRDFIATELPDSTHFANAKNAIAQAMRDLEDGLKQLNGDIS